MPETGASFVPAPLSNVASDPMTEAMAALLRVIKGFVVAGLDFTSDGTTAHISAGRGVVVTDAVPPSAYYVKLTATVDKPLVDNASNWIYLTYDANLTVNQTGIDPANSIPLFKAVVAGGVVTSTLNLRSSVLDMQGKLKVTGLDLSGGELTNLGAPGSNSSAARLLDVLTLLASVGGIKNPVRAASTANVPSMVGLLTIDAVSLASNDRVLLKDQTTTTQNGIWVVQNPGSWVRATDFDALGEALGGTLIAVSEGTVNGNAIFGLDTDDPVTPGTTAMAFSRRDVQAHQALTIAHGAVSAPTPSTMVARDGAGRTQFEAGAATKDAVNKGQMDTAVAAEATARASGDTAAVTTAEAYTDSQVAAEASARSAGDTYGLNRANHTGTQTASTISNFDTQVRTSSLNQMAAPTADVPMNSRKLTGLAAPTVSGDAARLDDISGGTYGDLFDRANAKTAATWLPPYPFLFTVVGSGARIGTKHERVYGNGASGGFYGAFYGVITTASPVDMVTAEKFEAVFLLNAVAFAGLNSGSLQGLEFNDGGGSAGTFTKTGGTTRMGVYVDSAGHVFALAADGTSGSSVTATDTGFVATAGTAFLVRMTYIKGTSLVVTINGANTTTITTTLPPRISSYQLANGAGDSNSITEFRGGVWR